jgi:hypothetical protein
MGIISGKNRYQYPNGTLLEYADCLQTDAAINPGNSGGGLFDAKGDLIGINGRGSFEKRGRVNVGVGYAISINQIKHFLSHLKSGRLVDHATLGATVESDDQGVVRVSDVLPSSDAFRRGLRYDDEILSFAGRAIHTVNQFKNVLGIFPKGFTVPIVFRRQGVEHKIDVRLAGVHAAGQLAEIVEGQTADDQARPKGRDDGRPNNKKPDAPNPQGGEDPPPGDADDDQERQNADPTDVSPSDRPNHRYGAMFVSRSGFANYYFNRKNRDRIWQQFVAIGGRWELQPGRWRISGRFQDSAAADDVPFQLFLGDQRSGIRIGDASYVLDPEQDFSSQLVPPGTGGLLVALHLWRTMLVKTPDRFGDVYYLGTLPVSDVIDRRLGGRSDVDDNDDRRDQNSGHWNSETQVEVLIATRGVTETHFGFSRRRALLQSAEMCRG